MRGIINLLWKLASSNVIPFWGIVIADLIFVCAIPLRITSKFLEGGIETAYSEPTCGLVKGYDGAVCMIACNSTMEITFSSSYLHN